MKTPGIIARPTFGLHEKEFFVRRTKRSPSFSQRGVGRYCFLKDGRKFYVTAKVSRDRSIGVDAFAINFLGRKKRRLGNISCVTGGLHWHIWDRIIENKALRGHGLGKLGFRLAEQEAKKRAGKTIYFSALRKDELSLALSLGYGLLPGSEQNLKKLLGLNLRKPLPDKHKLSELLKRNEVPYDQWNFGRAQQAIQVEKEL